MGIEGELLPSIEFCPKCDYNIKLFSNANLYSYFAYNTLKCPNCGEDLNLRKILLGMLDEISTHIGTHYYMLGCKSKLIEITLKTNDFYELDLSKEIGNGELLSIISISPNFPMGNTPMVPSAYIYPKDFLFRDKKTQLYGVPMGNGKDTNYSVNYVYAPENIKKDLSNMLLLDAFKFHAEEDFRNIILSANSAIEILFNKIFEKHLVDSLEDKSDQLSNKKKKKINHFLKDGATYGYKLYPLFPSICEITGIPRLDKDILSNLNNLRKDRNNLIHDGITDLSNKMKIKEELVAAFLTFKYFKLLHGF